jgi:hypothetical protein
MSGTMSPIARSLRRGSGYTQKYNTFNKD